MRVFIFRALNVPNGQLQSPKAASCAGRQRALPERRQTRATLAMMIQALGNPTLIGDAPEASVGRQTESLRATAKDAALSHAAL